MKIYNKIVLDKDNNIIEEDSFEYTGPITYCGGGGGSSSDGSAGVGADVGGGDGGGGTAPMYGPELDTVGS